MSTMWTTCARICDVRRRLRIHTTCGARDMKVRAGRREGNVGEGREGAMYRGREQREWEGAGD
eukprot:6213288-Pleurochrysis_carterae.AAC.4